MLEIAILTCVEAQKLIRNVTVNPILTRDQKIEVIQELLDRSDCKNGDVR